MTLKFALAALAAFYVGGSNSIALAASARIERFGQTQGGRAVRQAVLENDLGMRVEVIDFGATIRTISVPDRNGQFANVVLSLPDVSSYERSERRWASVIGRYAGRIGEAPRTADGHAYALQPGANGVTLHGGRLGYDKRLWESRIFSDRQSVGVILNLVSPDGDQGFPGTLRLNVTYRLMRRTNELRIAYEAKTDKPTAVNFTNHGFFNLGGAGKGNILAHSVRINADRFAETDDRKIPSGRLLSIAGTSLDFRKPRLLGPSLSNLDALLKPSIGYDHSLVFQRSDKILRAVGTIFHPFSGRRLDIATTEPSVQLNSGNGFVGSETGSEGVAYARYAGLAFETQHLPDSPNRRRFPSTMLRPVDRFKSETRLRFSIGGELVR